MTTCFVARSHSMVGVVVCASNSILEAQGVRWDATDGSTGGAERTAWETLLDMERYVAKAFENVRLKVVWAWATHFGFPRRILRLLCLHFQHQRRVIFEGSVADRCRPSRRCSQVRSGVVCCVVLGVRTR